MRRRSFRPTLPASALESRVSLSRVGFHAKDAHVVAYGNAVNRGLFDGLVEVKVHGRQYNAVFGNGQRMTPWLAVGHAKPKG